jgi:hypothetical protein
LSILVSSLTIAIASRLMTRIQFMYTLKGALGELGGVGILRSFLNQILIVVLAIVIIMSVVKIVQMILRIVRSALPSSESLAK